MSKRLVIGIVLTIVLIVLVVGFILMKNSSPSSECDNIKEVVSQSLCYQNLIQSPTFQKTNNLAVCDNIPTQSIKDECYAIVAVNKQDTSICDKIVENDLNTTSQPRDRCYIAIAKLKKDSTMCEQVSTQTDKFGWNNQNSCYTDVAVATKDISLCDKVSQSQQKETCTRSVNFAISGA